MDVSQLTEGKEIMFFFGGSKFTGTVKEVLGEKIKATGRDGTIYTITANEITEDEELTAQAFYTEKLKKFTGGADVGSVNVELKSGEGKTKAVSVIMPKTEKPELREYQKDAINKIESGGGGTVSLAAGLGKTGTPPEKPKRISRGPLNDEEILSIRVMLSEGKTHKAIAERFNIHAGTVSHVKMRRTVLSTEEPDHLPSKLKHRKTYTPTLGTGCEEGFKSEAAECTPSDFTPAEERLAHALTLEEEHETKLHTEEPVEAPITLKVTKNVIEDRCKELEALGMILSVKDGAYLFQDVNIDFKTELCLLNEEPWRTLVDKIKPVIEERKKPHIEEDYGGF